MSFTTCGHMKWFALALVGFVILPLGFTAQAQTWLDDRQQTEGMGVRFRQFELHPGVGAEAGYDSNVFYSDSDTGAVSSPVFRVSPHLFVSTLGSERNDEESTARASLRGGVFGSYYYFLDAPTRNDVSLGASVLGEVKPSSGFQLTLQDVYSREIRPFTEPGAVNNNYGHHNNRLSITGQASTPGDMFQASLGYELLLDLFESSSFQYLNSATHGFRGGLTWNFLPQTALLYRVDADLMTYTNQSSTPLVLLSDNQRISSWLGLSGALTSKMSAAVFVGYAAGFYGTLEDFDSVVARATVNMQMSPNRTLSFGFDRNFSSSYSGGFSSANRAFVDLSSLVGGVLMLRANLSAGYYSFGALLDPSGTPLGITGSSTRNDVRVLAQLGSEYRFSDWLAATATVRYSGDFTSFEYIRETPTGTLPDPAGFSKFEGWLGLRVFY